MPWFLSAKLSAEPLAKVSNKTLASTPAFSPMAFASLMATTVSKRIMLFSIFSTRPHPTGPHKAMSEAKVAISGSIPPNSSGSAPTMTANVPACAAARVRATGASANFACLAANSAASCLVPSTDEVPRSTTICPGRADASKPACWRQSCATIAPEGSERNTVSDWAITAEALPCPCTPSAAKRCNGAASRSNAKTCAPDLRARWRQMGSPMTPKPMNPITFPFLLPIFHSIAFSSHADVNALGLLTKPHAGNPLFPADAAVLETAERACNRWLFVGIDPDRPRFKRPRNTPCPLIIGSPDAGGKAKGRAICLSHQVFFFPERQHTQTRAKDFLLGNPRAVVDSSNDGRQVISPVGKRTGIRARAAGKNAGPCAPGPGHPSPHLSTPREGGQGAHFGARRVGQINAQRARPLQQFLEHDVMNGCMHE